LLRSEAFGISRIYLNFRSNKSCFGLMPIKDVPGSGHVCCLVLFLTVRARRGSESTTLSLTAVADFPEVLHWLA
jgi:hypothetical protein